MKMKHAGAKTPLGWLDRVFIPLGRQATRLANLPTDILAFAGLMGAFGLLAMASLFCFSRIVPVDRDVLKFFDVATEASIWTWANVAVLITGANIHLVAAYARWWYRKPGSLVWLATASLLAAFSLDDLTALHERLDGIGTALGGGSGFTHFAWVLPGAAIAICVVLAICMLIKRIPGRPRLYLLSGISLFFLGAVVMESVSGYVFVQYGPGVAYVLSFHLEEMTEATGSALLLCAGLADLPARYRRLGAFLRRSVKPG